MVIEELKDLKVLKGLLDPEEPEDIVVKQALKDQEVILVLHLNGKVLGKKIIITNTMMLCFIMDVHTLQLQIIALIQKIILLIGT